MVRPLLLAEPGPGDASCTTWTLSVYFHPLYFQAGRPSGKFANDRRRSYDLCRALPIRRSSSSVSSLATFLFSFRSVDLLRPVPTSRSSSSVSSLATFLFSSRSVDLLLPLPALRPSPFVSGLSAFSVLPAIPTLRLVGFSVTGDLSYSRKNDLSKP